MTAFQWALFFHVLGVFLLVGGMLSADVASWRGAQTENLRQLLALLAVVKTSDLAANGGAVMVLGFGLWLVHLGGFSYADAWVIAALALFVAQGAATGSVAGGRKRARVLALELSERGEESSAEPASLLGSPTAIALTLLANLITVTILVLMVWRPGA